MICRRIINLASGQLQVKLVQGPDLRSQIGGVVAVIDYIVRPGPPFRITHLLGQHLQREGFIDVIPHEQTLELYFRWAIDHQDTIHQGLKIGFEKQWYNDQNIISRGMLEDKFMATSINKRM